MERESPSKIIYFVDWSNSWCFIFFGFYLIGYSYSIYLVDDLNKTLFLFFIACCKCGFRSNFLSRTCSKDIKRFNFLPSLKFIKLI